jgi:dehydrogenase/reductase SDR family protein 4
MTAPGASIVFVSSVTAFAPAAPIAVYAASKTALVALARALSDELAPHVRVNVVAPGIVPTKFAAALVEADDGAAAIAQTKLQRLGTPGDIAAAVAYLASEDAGWVTGETLVVAGGMAASRL